MSSSLISPSPTKIEEQPPHIGAGLRFVDAPTRYLRELRENHGETFLLDVFGFQLFFTFSPKGLESLYELEEEKASFGFATYDLVGFKTPVEVLADADIRLFYELLAHKNMPRYLQLISSITDLEIQRWGNTGQLEIFDAIRTLEQRIGYGLWIAEEASAVDGIWPQLKKQFDVLDQERSFVDPKEILTTIKTDKAREREAVDQLSRLIGSLIDQRGDLGRGDSTIDFLYNRFSGFPSEQQRKKIIHNVINANQGFLSNLYAGIAWVIVNLHYHPEVKEKVVQEIRSTRERYGDDFLGDVEALNSMGFLEQVLMESVRLAQRSLTLRKVLQPITLDDGTTSYSVQPGVYIATMLSVTNVQADEFARFDPEHYQKNKLAPSLTVAGKHSISTFGHGKHACPAQRFSHHMCKIVITKLLEQFNFHASSEMPQPSERQMGGVARPDEDLIFDYVQLK